MDRKTEPAESADLLGVQSPAALRPAVGGGPGPVVAADAFTAMVERMATDHRVDMDKLERLIVLNREMRAEQARTDFDAALADMQPEIPSIIEGGKIEHSGRLISTYALFEDINDTIKPILHKHGFALSHRLTYPDKQIVVTGILSHRGGHREQTQFIAEADSSGAKNNIQARKSTISYGMRTVTCALLNITTRGADDDGNAGGGAPAMSEDHQATVTALCDEINSTMLAKVLQSYKAKTLAQVADTEYPGIVARLNKRRQETPA